MRAIPAIDGHGTDRSLSLRTICGHLSSAAAPPLDAVLLSLRVAGHPPCHLRGFGQLQGAVHGPALAADSDQLQFAHD